VRLEAQACKETLGIQVRKAPQVVQEHKGPQGAPERKGFKAQQEAQGQWAVLAHKELQETQDQ
jgi:hypothetical protein